MPSLLRTELTDDIRQRASRIRLVCFDVDGTLTTALHYDARAGSPGFPCARLSGHGAAAAAAFGITVAFLTARNSQSAAHRAADLGVHGVHWSKDKLAQVRVLCVKGHWPDEVAFMGDDLPTRGLLAVAWACPRPMRTFGSRACKLDHQRRGRQGCRA